jgi:hypothetical protein
LFKQLKDPVNRRKFFENFAAENGFDPLNPRNWHSLPREKIMAAKVSYFSSPFPN